MKEIILILTEKNILDSLLYSVTKSNQFKKSRKTGRLLFGAIFLLLTLIFLVLNKFIAGLTFVVGVIIFVLFPQYLKIYYKKHFTKLSKSNENKKLLGLEYRITFKEEYIEIRSLIGESKLLYNSFDYISETKENIFIKLKTAVLLTFPKNQINNISELKNYFETICAQYKIEYLDDENWTWK